MSISENGDVNKMLFQQKYNDSNEIYVQEDVKYCQAWYGEKFLTQVGIPPTVAASAGFAH
jgi:hypothetical protein